jgi:hypothetical protein
MKLATGPVRMPPVVPLGVVELIIIRIVIPFLYWMMKMMVVPLVVVVVVRHQIHRVVLTRALVVAVVIVGDPPHQPTIDLVP